MEMHDSEVREDMCNQQHLSTGQWWQGREKVVRALVERGESRRIIER
jgi:hypothetical protein